MSKNSDVQRAEKPGKNTLKKQKKKDEKRIKKHEKLEEKLYKKWSVLEEKIQKISNYDYAMSVLGWDANAAGAPNSGADARAESLGQLATHYYECVSSDETSKLIDDLSREKYRESLGSKRRAVVKNLKRTYDRISAIPVDEYAKYSKLCSKAEIVWTEARSKDDFELFKPYLEKIIDYNKRFIEYRGGYDHPYDVLVGDYEPDVSVKTLDAFFDEIGREISPLYKDVKLQNGVVDAVDKQGNDAFIIGKLSPVSGQRNYSHRLARMLGYDVSRGLIAESAHPFSVALCRDDARITTAYDQFDLFKAVFSTAHEAGHAIFEQGVDIGLISAFNAKYISYGLHESQSRFYENHVVRSREFFELEWKNMAELINHKLKKIGSHAAYNVATTVSHDTIRIDADELSYPLHILIRYDIEKAVFEGNVSIDRLPELWNDKTEEYLGVRPESNAKGILQDIHWASGSFGYFPSYALGSAYAAQMAAAMERDFPLSTAIKSGDFNRIKEWLNVNVHSTAGVFNSLETIERATGERFNPKYYTDCLKNKYGNCY